MMYRRIFHVVYKLFKIMLMLGNIIIDVKYDVQVDVKCGVQVDV